jgi:hypothetical protein
LPVGICDIANRIGGFDARVEFIPGRRKHIKWIARRLVENQ